jgi:hypothetical protein
VHDIEAHHVACRPGAEAVRQYQLCVQRVAGEIHDHLEALGLRNIEVLMRNRRRERSGGGDSVCCSPATPARERYYEDDFAQHTCHIPLRHARCAAQRRID